MSDKFIAVGSYSHLEKYHTKETCPYVVDGFRPASEHEIEHKGLDHCDWCDPNQDVWGGPENHTTTKFQDREYLDKLQEAHHE